MYRFLVLCLLVSAASSHRHWCEEHPGRCHRHNHSAEHENDGDFHSLSWDVINADRKVNRICKINEIHMSETYDTSYYKLSVNLPDFTEDDISIKFRHRVMLVQALKPNVKVFSEIKILPENVNPTDAAWTFEDNQLVIKMVYREPLGTEVAKTCSSTIDDAVIDIPKGLNIDARFGA